MKSELVCRRVERTAGCVALKGDYALNHGFYSCAGGGRAFPCAFPNPVKVSFGERCGRPMGSLQEPSFKLRRGFVRLSLLVVHAAKHVIGKFAGVMHSTRNMPLLTEPGSEMPLDMGGHLCEY